MKKHEARYLLHIRTHWNHVHVTVGAPAIHACWELFIHDVMDQQEGGPVSCTAALKFESVSSLIILHTDIDGEMLLALLPKKHTSNSSKPL